MSADPEYVCINGEVWEVRELDPRFWCPCEEGECDQIAIFSLRCIYYEGVLSICETHLVLLQAS